VILSPLEKIMNYHIEKHDMQMILDALECLREHIKNNNNSPYAWNVEDVDGLFQSFDNNFVENN